MVTATAMMLLSLSVAVDHPPVAPDNPAACTTCHAPVRSHRVMHGPAAVSACTTCHAPVESGGRRRIGLARGARSGDTRQLCISCHEDVGTRLKSAHLHAPVAAGDCTACHDPHGSEFRYQLPVEGNQACLTCHEDVAAAMTQAVKHSPALARCTLCHDAHASGQPSQLRADANVVCLACHVEVGARQRAAGPADVFGKSAATTHGHLADTAPRIRLDAAMLRGHPTLGHPVAAGKDPLRPGRTFTCASCHNPHGASARGLLRFGATGVSSLCIRCHQY